MGERVKSTFSGLPSTLALALLGLTLAWPASAQVTKFNTINLLAAPPSGMLGVAVATDPVGDALVVSGTNEVVAQCVNSDGVPGAVITLKPYAAAGIPYASYPRARFGSTSYLVVWPEEHSGGVVVLMARTVSCPTGALGVTHQIGDSAWGAAMGPAIAYSATSAKYLVAWKTLPTAAGAVIRVQLVNADGTMSGAPVQVSSGFGRDPGVAWNPIRNEFGVSYSGEIGDSGAFSAFVVVPATNPAAFRRVTFNTISGGRTYLTDMAFNTQTQHYLMSWFQLAPGATAKVAEFDSVGTLLNMGVASTTLGSYDALSMAFNPASGTSLIAGIDGADQLRVAELNAHGVRFAAEQTVATGFNPIRYPRVDGSGAGPRWFTALSRGNGKAAFQGTGEVVFQTGTRNGGPAGSYATTSSSGGSTGSSGSCTTPKPGANWICVNGNWLPPTTGGGSTGGTSTGSCTTVSPGAGWTCVNGSWHPPSSTGGTSTSSCKTVSPGAGWTCVNGSWFPPTTSGGSSGGTTSGSTAGCTTVSPGSGWVCQKGSWLPPGSPLIVSCPTVQPGAGWRCVNGGWLPPLTTSGGTTSGSTGGTSTATCKTVQPGTGWVCQNGSWLPPGSSLIVTPTSCTTVQPGVGWTCVSGNWHPPTTSSITSTNDGTCAGSAPASGWVCQKGSWLPSDSPLIK
jgi:hypothetical protein